jgi:hypothetical protein
MAFLHFGQAGVSVAPSGLALRGILWGWEKVLSPLASVPDRRQFTREFIASSCKPARPAIGNRPPSDGPLGQTVSREWTDEHSAAACSLVHQSAAAV